MPSKELTRDDWTKIARGEWKPKPYDLRMAGFDALKLLKRAESAEAERRSLRKQRAEHWEPVVPPTIKISEVVAAVSLEQNRKWNGRVGYMAGWNACRDAMLFTAAKRIALEAEDVNNKVDITCYSCRRFITFRQHAEADGFCPYCGVEIELTPSTLAVPNVKTIEDNLIEQVGLMCDQATNIEEKNVYGHAYCVLKYGILPYLRKKENNE
ncbi:TPA: zinc-ribbon domain-containing protein [Yersinia enterocolitica]